MNNKQQTNKKTYQLIAFDMDGTLLNRKSRISEETMKALREAAACGKDIVISTGRSLSEVVPYRAQFGGIRYAILESGAMLYDFREEKVLKRIVFPQKTVDQLVAVSREEEMLLQVMTDGKSIIEQAFVDYLETVGMKGAKEFVEQCETVVPDVREMLLRGACAFEKINFYHMTQEARRRSLERVRSIDAEAAFSAGASLEMSPSGVSKGTALAELAAAVGVPPENTIAVGDSDNDRTMLERAGLAVAMANADESLKAIADVIVASNEEDGCAEAIRRFLL